MIYESLGAQNSLAGGGRYNGLIEQLGGKSIPAIGFAGGFERLLLALEQEQVPVAEAPVPDIYLIALGEQAQQYILPYLNELRCKGLYVEYAPDKVSFKAQLKAANQSQARHALIIGEDEVNSNRFVIKDLASGEQHSLPLRSTEDIIRAARQPSPDVPL